MTPNLLILGGTVEASALARKVAEAGISATLSFAGRVERTKPQPIPIRVGGFGGVQGLAEYLRAHRVTHLIDATHPFAAQMSRNALQAAALAGVPMAALTRAPWQRQPGDRWTEVPDIAGAVAALHGPARRVMLAVGRMHLAEFAPNPQHFYLLRLVDPVDGDLPFPNVHALIDRGPFSYDSDLALLRDHRIDLVVSKNAGGTGARAKIDAARDLGLKVLMIQRPELPQREEVHSAEDAMAWLAAHPTDRGV